MLFSDFPSQEIVWSTCALFPISVISLDRCHEELKVNIPIINLANTKFIQYLQWKILVILILNSFTFYVIVLGIFFESHHKKSPSS